MTESRISKPKRKRTLERIALYTDHDAAARSEPGPYHSFAVCLATLLDRSGICVDPVWLMGATGFAFRLWIHEHLLPSSMNVFDWELVLPFAVRQMGFACHHIYRSFRDPIPAAARRQEAHEAILRSIDKDRPAIAWDVNDPPMWGLIYGYNDFTAEYQTMAVMNYCTPLPYDKLGARDVQTLSVLTLGDEVRWDEETVIQEALEAALAHAVGAEGGQYPGVLSGVGAYALWADLMAPGALEPSGLSFADYYARMFHGFRCYAREFLRRIADRSEWLALAARKYAKVADLLGQVSHILEARLTLPGGMTDGVREDLSSRIRLAAEAEQAGLDHIRFHLSVTSPINGAESTSQHAH